jgi:hypothetical protein
MKDNSSTSSKMISRNWVLKRKRKKILYGRVVSTGKEDNLESPRNTSAAKRRPKSEQSSDLSSSKKKGNDGVSYPFVLFSFLLDRCFFSSEVYYKFLIEIVCEHILLWFLIEQAVYVSSFWTIKPFMWAINYGAHFNCIIFVTCFGFLLLCPVAWLFMFNIWIQFVLQNHSCGFEVLYVWNQIPFMKQAFFHSNFDSTPGIFFELVLSFLW